MRSEDLKDLWQFALEKQPDAVVMPCICGTMPAPVTNISGDERRRCWHCYETQFRISMDFWSN